jgi:hypothetical protein
MNGAPYEDCRSAESSVVWRTANRLALAATPVFGLMALITGLGSAGAWDILCGAARGAPWNGMTAMYLLMSFAHLPPWLKLLASRRVGKPKSDARGGRTGLPVAPKPTV